MRRVTRITLIAAGTISVTIGIVGVFVPLLPTTPFLLLAVFLYGRSSGTLYKSLLDSRWIGEYIRRYYERRSMTRRHKAITLALLWGGLGTSGAFAVTQWWARFLLAVVGVGVTMHLLWLETEKANRPN